MKKTTLLLLLLTITFFACQKKELPLIVKKNYDFEKGESLVFTNYDSAYYYFNNVVRSATADSLTIATSYQYMGIIQAVAGDYFGGQESLIKSIQFLDPKNTEHFACLSSDYNELGIISFNLREYALAQNYHDLALKFVEDEGIRSMILNNKALTYQKTGDYIKAINIYKRILSNYKDHPKEYARTLSNLAKTRWLRNPDFKAASDLLKALTIRNKHQDEWGQNASFAHLSDYYAVNQVDSALFYANKMYQMARKLKSPDDQLEALQKLIQLDSPTQAQLYFKTYHYLEDSLQTARNSAKNQFAMVRYETEKSKADNLILQQENTKKKYQVLTRELLLGAAILLFSVITIIALFWYRKRKQRMELETQNTIRDSQLKTSKRVHDVVANGLYRVMTEIENQEAVDRERILDKIEDLYEKSRDISYEKPMLSEQNFHEEISELLRSFATADTKILIAGNTKELWQKVNPTVRYEVEHVIQELMVNMKKHSLAKHVALKFESTGNQFTINYKDDGIGMPADQQFKNGLRNTGNRIDFIKGAITFETNLEKGLNVRISFPLA